MLSELAQDPSAGAMNQDSPETALKIISYKDLLKNSWSLVITEFPVFIKTLLFVVIAFTLLSASLFLLSHEVFIGPQLSFWLTLLALPIVGMVIALLASFSLMRALVLRATEPLYRVHVKYVAKHLFGITLVSLYLTIFTQFGYSLFFVPGFVASIYLVFSSLLVVSGKYRGFDALSNSITLVYGRFFPVLGRFFVTNFVIFFLIASAFLLVSFGLFGYFKWSNHFGLAVGDIPLFFFGLILFIVGGYYWLTCALVILYESVQALPVAEALPIPKAKLEKWLMITALIIVLIVGLLAPLDGFFGWTDSVLYELGAV